MSSNVLDTKSKVLQVAIEAFGLKGDVTVREITESAGVNVASINYYFGNKNNLLKEIEHHYANLLNNTQYEILNNEEINSFDKLVKWAYNLANFMFRFPALVELIINLSTEEKNYSPALIEKIYLNQDVQNLVRSNIIESIGHNDPVLIKNKYLQLFSGIIGVVSNHMIAQTFYKNLSINDINNEEELEQYIRMFIKDILVK